ncbi:MAG: cohesin domain-containing protein, partial [Eubacteriales bacterium]
MLRKMKRKLAMVLAAVLMVTMMPVMVFAAGETLVANKAALTAAFAAGGNIQLTASIACGTVSGDIFTVGSGKTITLDLNGFQISGDTNTGGIIRNSGNLTIVDTSVAKGGNITNTNTTGTGAEVGGPSVQYAKSAISNLGTLTVNAGVTIAGPALGHGRYYSPDLYYFNPAYGIDNLGGGNVTINGATVTGSNCMRNFANVTGTSITVNGGTFTGRTGIAMQSFGSCIGSLTVNGNTSITALYSAIFAGGSDVNNSIVINGGVFTGGDAVNYYATIDVNKGSVTINGGTFTDNSGEYYSLVNYYAAFNVTAGTFNGNIWGGYSPGLTTFAPASGKHIYVNSGIYGATAGANLTETNNILIERTGYGFDTIAAAVAAANVGDIIDVSGTVDLNTSAGAGPAPLGVNVISALIVDKNITIKGVGSNPTITCSLINPNGSGVVSVYMKQGEIKNLTIKRPAGDGPNLLVSGVYLQGTAKITDCLVKNFRTGVEARGNNEIVGNTIQSNRTGILYLSSDSVIPVVMIVNNTVTDNRTFGILFLDGGTYGGHPGRVYSTGYSFTIKGNEIYDNWYAELESRNVNAINITNNFWGAQGPVLIHDYVNETLHPADGGSIIATKPGRPAGGIYQPTHSTSITKWNVAAYQDFTAGALTLDIAAPVFTPPTDATGIAVQAASNIVPVGATLAVTPIDNNDAETLANIALAVQGETGAIAISAAYDISLVSGGVEIEPNGNITISLPIPLAARGQKISILHILDDGTVETLTATISPDGLTATFVTKSLSDFVLLAGNNVPVAFTATCAVGKAGNNVTVNVNIAADSASGTGTIVLPYDHTKLEVVSAVAGAALSGVNTSTDINTTSTATTLAYIYDAPDGTGLNVGGTVLSVTYKILAGTADGVLSVAPSVTEFCDTAILSGSLANNLSYTIDYGEIRVDNTAPIAATLSPSTTDPTNQNVTVTITYPGDAAQMLYNIDGGSWTAYTTALSQPANCTVYAKGIDAAGNESAGSSLIISNIDKTNPAAATLSPNIANTTPTNTDVLVTITYPSTPGDSFIKQYKIGSGSWTDYTIGTPVTVTANNTVYAKSRDAAGNWSAESSLDVTNIDKAAPGDATLSASTGLPTNSLTVSITYPTAFAGDSFLRQYSYNNSTWDTYTTTVPVSI